MWVLIYPFYVDDTKTIKRIKSADDVIELQEDLIKLHQWGVRNKIMYNGDKFVAMRYGKDKELTENTTYFSGEMEEVIEEKYVTKDLGVLIQNYANFTKHIEKASSKSRQKAGWLHRTFYCKRGWFLRHMWNSLVQPHLNYCSQLWSPGEGKKLQNIEKILKYFTSEIPDVNHLNYWMRLRKLKINSRRSCYLYI